MRNLVVLFLCTILVASGSGCLGTLVGKPPPQGQVYSTTRAHLLASPTRIDSACGERGYRHVFTFVPLWGVAVGILTVGILVPMTTNYSCATAP